jgi:DNA-binding transcriptional LysR family regulator
MAKRLGPFRFVLCASPAYLQQRGVPQVPDDLAQHACLRFRFPTSGKLESWRFRGLPEDTVTRFPTAMICNNMEAMRAAAELGLGIAYMPHFLASDALQSGALVSVLAGHIEHAGQFSVLWPSSRQLSPKLRVWVDFLSERLFPEPMAGA